MTLDDIASAARELVQQNHMLVMAALPLMPRLFLVAVALEMARSGSEDVDFDTVARRVRVECARLGGYCEEIAAAGGGMGTPVEKPNRGEQLALCQMLGGARLLLVDRPRAQRELKIRLNMQLDDVYFALQGDATVGQLLRQ